MGVIPSVPQMPEHNRVCGRVVAYPSVSPTRLLFIGEQDAGFRNKRVCGTGLAILATRARWGVTQSESKLLTPQRDQRIDFRRAPCWNVARQHGNRP